jgi:hypothetical protein
VSRPQPDLSEFYAIASAHPDVCVIARSKAQLKGKDRVNLEEALTRMDDEGAYVVGHSTIARWLKNNGLPGRDDAVRKHREGGCCCAQA